MPGSRRTEANNVLMSYIDFINKPNLYVGGDQWVRGSQATWTAMNVCTTFPLSSVYLTQTIPCNGLTFKESHGFVSKRRNDKLPWALKVEALQSTNRNEKSHWSVIDKDSNWCSPKAYKKHEMRTSQESMHGHIPEISVWPLVSPQPAVWAPPPRWNSLYSWNHSVTSYCGIICLPGSLPTLSLPQRPDLFS